MPRACGRRRERDTLPEKSRATRLSHLRNFYMRLSLSPLSSLFSLLLSCFVTKVSFARPPGLLAGGEEEEEDVFVSIRLSCCCCDLFPLPVLLTHIQNPPHLCSCLELPPRKISVVVVSSLLLPSPCFSHSGNPFLSHFSLLSLSLSLSLSKKPVGECECVWSVDWPKMTD